MSVFQLSGGDYGNSLIKEVQEDLHEDDESGAASIKAEISSLTAQFETLNRRASE